MAHHKAKSSQNASSVTKQVNVTGLTLAQKRRLFTDYYTQSGFSGFIKKKTGKQTYYTFTYKIQAPPQQTQ
jgi:hypothetical protein